MSYPIKYPTPQGANIQIFNASETKGTQTWVKPQGVSFVWFTLIGAGGGGDGATAGGGSGAVTNCMVPAFLIPDSLQIKVGQALSGGSTLIIWQGSKASAGYTLLTANGGPPGVAGTGASASPSNYFSAMGFYQSTQGDPDLGGSASTTSFLSPGSQSQNSGNYGYSQGNNGLGYFQMQPIIVGVGGCGSTTTQATTAIGCGGAQGGVPTIGGDGLVVIITW